MNPERFIRTMECEVLKDKDGNWIPDGQSQHKVKGGPNGKEDSWGVMQINLRWNPSVSREEAQNPLFAIPWSIERFKEGKARLWTCYRLLYDQ